MSTVQQHHLAPQQEEEFYLCSLISCKKIHVLKSEKLCDLRGSTCHLKIAELIRLGGNWSFSTVIN